MTDTSAPEATPGRVASTRDAAPLLRLSAAFRSFTPHIVSLVRRIRHIFHLKCRIRHSTPRGAPGRYRGGCFTTFSSPT
jgi:hypothetical protein